MKFIIWCWDYSKFIVGVRVMHKLCDILNSLGTEAYVTAKKTNPDWNTPVYDGNGFDKEQTVVIYPECISDNLLDAKHVVRWILYNQVAEYNPLDHVFKLFKGYYTHGDKCDGMLQILDFHLEKWYDQNLERPYNMVLYRKGAWKQPYIDLSIANALIYDEIEKEENEDLIANCMNKSINFISYDDCSFAANQAAMCGCNTIIVPHPNIDADTWRSKREGYLKYGVAYGFDEKEIKYAQETRHLIKPYLQSFNDQSIGHGQNFIEYWKNIIK